MARYIDADKMREDWLNNGENECIYDTNAVLDSIDSQPTADVVEVVRCRDCKYYSVTHCPITGHELSVCLQGVSQQWVGENHFCSYGERREQG